MVGEELKNSRRTQANSVHRVGGSVGSDGRPAANGLSAAVTRLDTMPVT